MKIEEWCVASKGRKWNWLYLVNVIFIGLVILCIVVLLSVRENPHFKRKTGIYTGYHNIPQSGDLRLPGTVWTVFGKFPKYRFTVFGRRFSRKYFVGLDLCDAPNSYTHVLNTISTAEAEDLASRLNAALDVLEKATKQDDQDVFATRNILHTSGYGMTVSGSVRYFFVSDFRWEVETEMPESNGDSKAMKVTGHIRLRLHDRASGAFPVESRLSLADAIALSKQLASALENR